VKEKSLTLKYFKNMACIFCKSLNNPQGRVVANKEKGVYVCSCGEKYLFVKERDEWVREEEEKDID
jgi:peptide methionine sulfoxide reductase MsrB